MVLEKGKRTISDHMAANRSMTKEKTLIDEKKKT